jgi:hypothetical protein
MMPLDGRILGFVDPGRTRLAGTPGLAQSAPQQELDLAVQTAQLVISPALDIVQHLAIDSQ